MTQLEVPLIFRTLQATGDVVLRAELILAIRTQQGSRVDAAFVVDPGTEMTTMSAA